MALPAEDFPTDREQIDHNGSLPVSETPYTDHLITHLDSEGLGFEAISSGDHLEAVLALDGFARAHAQRLADDRGTRLVLLPSSMTRLNASGYIAEIQAAPAHRPRLVKELAAFAVRYGRTFPQVIVATNLFSESWHPDDPLKNRTADLLATYGKTIGNLRGFKSGRR